MPTNIYTGSAVSKEAIYRFTPPSSKGRLKLTIGSKTQEIDDSTPQQVATAFNNSQFPEFRNIRATVASNGNAVLFTGQRGIPYHLTGEYAPLARVDQIQAGEADTNQIVKATVPSYVTGGSIKLAIDFPEGTERTAAFDPTAQDGAAVETLLESLASITSGDVDVSGPTGGPWTIELQGDYSGQSIAFRVVEVGITGAAVAKTETLLDGSGTNNPDGLFEIGEEFGTAFTLTYDSQTTVDMVYGWSAERVQAEIEALSSVGSGNVKVYGGRVDSEDTGGEVIYWILFSGSLAGTAITDADLTVSIGNKQQLNGGGAAGDKDARWLIDLADFPTSYEFRLTFRGVDGVYQTGWLAANCGGSALQSAINNEFDYTAVNASTAVLSPATYPPENFYSLKFVGGEFADNAVPTPTLEVRTGTDGEATEYPDNVITLEPGGTSVNEKQIVWFEQSDDEVEITGGTFKLTHNSNETAAINFGAGAEVVEDALEALAHLSSGDVSVVGHGTELQPYEITFQGGEAATDVGAVTVTDNSVTGSVGISPVTVQAAAPGQNEVWELSYTENADGGSFVLGMDGETGTVTVDTSTTDSALETAMVSAFGALASGSVIDVEANAGGNVFSIQFLGDLSKTPIPALFIVSQALTASGVSGVLQRVQEATGPGDLANADNWSLARPWQTDDDVVFETAVADIDTNLNALGVATFTNATSRVTMEQTGLRNDMAVRVSIGDGGTLPTGLSASTTYYVINYDPLTDSFQLATTVGGSAVSFSDDGSGTLYCGIRLNSFRWDARVNRRLGRPAISADGYAEYLPRYCSFGLLSSGDKKVTIGQGPGSGSPLMRIATHEDEAIFNVLATGTSTEQNQPALCLLCDTTATELTGHTGDIGVAAYAGESGSIGWVIGRGADITLGRIEFLYVDVKGGTFQADNAQALSGNRVLIRA